MMDDPIRISAATSEAQAKQTYTTLRPSVITTFTLPHHTVDPNRTYEIDFREIFKRRPFRAFAIRETFDCIDDRNGKPIIGAEEMVVNIDPETSAIVYASRFTYNGGFVAYGPLPVNAEERSRAMAAAIKQNIQTDDLVMAPGMDVLVRLYEYLYDRKTRFLEEKVSRQVRRSENRPDGYREFVAIRKDDVRYQGAERAGAMLKRLKTLHAVRGHLRHYRAARYVNVKGQVRPVAPHTRGSGDLFQVRDYRVGG